MIKKILIGMIFLSSTCIFASNVSKGIAQQVASSFYRQNIGRSDKEPILEIWTTDNSALLYYINFKLGGWVIISGDDNLQPIIAYSINGELPKNNISNDVAWFLNFHQDKIVELRKTKSSQTPSVKAKWNSMLGVPPSLFKQIIKSSTAVDPLLKTEWGQGFPYNELCPSDQGIIVPAGCGAISMAQVIRYWEHPNKGVGAHSYNSKIRFENFDYENTYFNYSNMPNSANQSELEISKLIYACGVGLDMYYTKEASGSDINKIPLAMINYFDYAASADWIEYGVATDSAFKAIIINDLLNNRPLIMGGGNHGWVCDGFDGNGYFHMNWGWTGSHNGYYLLDNLKPDGNDYSKGLCLVYGIKPNDGSTINQNKVWGPGRINVESDIAVTENKTLEIRPGTTLNFNGLYSLKIYGKLKAEGTKTDSIVITSLGSQKGHGIVFDNYYSNMNPKDTSIIRYARIENCDKTVWSYGPRWKMPGTNFASMWGGAIYICKYSSVVVERCLIQKNKAESGSALYLMGNVFTPDPTLTMPIIRNNTIKYHRTSCAISIHNASPFIINNQFIDNNRRNFVDSQNGTGQLSMSISKAKVINNLFYTSYVDYLTSFMSYIEIGTLAEPQFVNNTIIGSYLNIGSTAKPTFINNIIWTYPSYGNVATVFAYAPATATFSHCNLQPNAYRTEDLSRIVRINDLLMDDPKFKNMNSLDFSLSDISKCVNAGTQDTSNLGLPLKDLFGNSRIYGGRIDIGAIENQSYDKLQIPLAPELLFPNNNQTILKTSVDLKWNKVENVEKYSIQLAKDSLFISIVVCDSSNADTIKSLTGLEYNTKYFWRIRGQNSKGYGQWSSVFNFAIKYMLIFPIENQHVQSKDLTFRWTGITNANKYLIFLYGFYNHQITALDMDSTSTDTLRSTNLLRFIGEGQKYYWKVQAKNSAKLLFESDLCSFITNISAPQNLLVRKLSLKEATLTWTIVVGYLLNLNGGYILERKKNAETIFSVLDTIKNNDQYYSDKRVEPGVKYSYRIKAYTQFTESNYSNEATLTLDGITDEKIPIEYTLFQNYPNPFNPTTKIKYSIPKTSFITLKVYDLLGKEIRNLVSEEKLPGNYEVLFNGLKLSSGVYFYRFQTGPSAGSGQVFTDTKKFILMK